LAKAKIDNVVKKPKTALVIPRSLRRGVSNIRYYDTFRFTKRSLYKEIPRCARDDNTDFLLDNVTPQEVDFFSFSFDGPDPAVNDPIRGKGSFAHCTAGIRAARRRGFGTSLIYTVSRDNIEALQRMPPLLAELGVDRFFIQVIGIRGKSAERAEHAERLQVSKADWLAAVAPVARAVADMGITVTWPKVYLDLAESFECAGRVAENFFIFPNGRVYRCPLCEDFPLHAFIIEGRRLAATGRINETDLFQLDIPEGCVMNRLIQPGNIEYDADGKPLHRIACCLLKEEISHC
jgi:hypothetical protein